MPAIPLQAVALEVVHKDYLVEYSFIAVRLRFPCATVTAFAGCRKSAGTHEEDAGQAGEPRPETARMGAIPVVLQKLLPEIM